MRRMASAGFLFAALLAAPAASAQIFTPTYQAPRTSSDMGLYLSDGPGDFAVEGILRRNFGGYDLGFRIGVADTHDASLLIGGELRNPLLIGTEPIDVAFTAGIQALVGDASGLGFHGGLTLGHTFRPVQGGFTFTPYVHPRLALVEPVGDDDFGAELLADLGLDFDFASGISLRVGIPFADLRGPDAAWGIGLAWR